jgi:hypothetical protein
MGGIFGSMMKPKESCSMELRLATGEGEPLSFSAIWQNRVIFVPDSKTAEGRRLVPMSRRVSDLLRTRCGTRSQGWVFPSNLAASGHLRQSTTSSERRANKTTARVF